ncbi:MAG: LPXTG cell wall anchor domain-containing protein [Oscillospiraceae bacterium]|jgi:LPXTG-motif cell wall-anchored protein|nr:LPXTG cell wall anchor domain-containing protein [Oscillospiraceae bacterium]
MKKVLGLILALALALSMASLCFAEATTASPVSEAKDDIEAILEELSGTVGIEELQAVLTDVIADLQSKSLLPADLENLDAASLSDGTSDAFADGLISGLNLGGSDLEAKIQGAMSNDFVSFLAGLYTGPVVTTEATTTTTAVVTTTAAALPETGSSSTIAIATFATLSAVAAVAFVCMKKKEA